MSRTTAIVFVLMVLQTACSTSSVVIDPESRDATETILVTVHNPDNEQLLGSPARIQSYNSSYGRSTRARQQLRSLSRDYSLTQRDAWAMKSLGLLCQVFEIPASESDNILAELSDDPRVESVQRMNRFHTLRDSELPEAGGAGTRNTTALKTKPPSSQKNYRSLQHNLDVLDVDAVHATVTGKNVTVAVIDTRVDARHPNLAASISAQFNVLQDSDAVSADAHGTAVAGVIAARPVGGEGILGVSPDAQIMAITACWSVRDETGECNSFTLARAIDLAIDKAAHIINLSLHGPPDPLLTRLVEQALSQGVIVVGAFSDTLERAFPGSIPGVLSAAIIRTSGDTLTLPGTDVLTTAPNNRYDFVSGNSIAAAQLSGMAALAIEAAPTLTPMKLRQILNSNFPGHQTFTACQMVNAMGSSLFCAIPAKTTNPSSDSMPTSP